MITIEKPIQILHLEDDANDAELVEATLDGANLAFQISRVQTAGDFGDSLRQGRYDLVLADYRLPGYDGLSALSLVLDQFPDTPFIFVSGTLGEDAAIHALTEGAIDYVTKQKLSRLAPAVTRALREMENQRRRRRAEEELRRSNALLERIFSATEFLMAYLDVNFNFIRVNRAFAEEDNQTPDFFAGKNYFSLYPDLENEAIFHRVVETGESYAVYAKPYVYPEHPERGMTYWNWTVQPIKEPDETVSGLVLSLVNVTEREKAILAQRESDERYRTLIEQASDGIFFADPQGNLMDVNPSGCSLLGYTREEILQLNLIDLASAETRHKIPVQFEALHARASVTSERTLVTKHGTMLPVEVSEKVLDNGHLLGIVRDITKRKHAENALRESELKIRGFVESSSEGFMLVSEQGVILEWNYAHEKITGLPANQVIGRTLWDVQFHLFEPESQTPEQYEHNKQAILNALQTGQSPLFDKVLEAEVVRPDGVRRFIQHTVFPIKTGTGYRMGSVTRDITEGKQAEKEHLVHLRFFESMDQINRAIQGMNDPEQMMSDVLDLVLSIFECDRAYLLYPCDPNAPSWQVRAERTRPEYPGLLALGIDEIPVDAYVAKTFRVLLNADGPVTFGPGNSHPLPASATERFGHKSFMSMAFYPKVEKPWQFGVHQCSYPRIWTSEDKRLFHEIGRRLSDAWTVLLTYRHLQESEERYRQLVNLSPDGISIHSEGRVQFANPAMVRMLGATSVDQLIGKSMLDGIHPDFREVAQNRIHEMESTGQPSPFIEEKLLRLDGSSIDVELAAVPHKINNTRYIQIVARDITERKRTEEALRESEERLRQIASSLREVVWLRDVKTRQVLYVNPAFQELTGRTCESFYENRDLMIDAVHPDDKEWVIKALSQRFEGVPFDKEHRIIHLDGSVRWVASRIFPVRNEAGEVYRSASIIEDITERKHHELERESMITVSTALRKATTRTEIITVLLDQLVELFEADGSLIALPNPREKGFVIEMGRGIVGERFTGLIIPPGKGVTGWVIENKQPYLNNQVDTDPLFYRPDLLLDARCVASVPLIAQEQALGALWIARHTNILEQELRLLNAIAGIAANAIHRVMLHEQIVEQLHHLIALHQIDLAISANFDLDVILNVILKNVKTELEVDAASLLLIDPVTHTLDYAAGIGFRTRGIEDSHVKLGQGHAGRAAQEYCTVATPDLNQAPGTFHRLALLADEGFAAHYVTPLVVKGQVKGVLEIFHRKVLVSEREWIDYFETLATQAAIAIENTALFENLQRSNMELMLAYDATIEGWSRALDLRDRETEGHTQRVTEMLLKLADKMEMSDAEKMDLRRGAMLHDIGKMGVPDSILLKPGTLSEREWQIMRQHPLYAFQMLFPIAYLKRALEIPYCHHERWDGSGYPRGLKREEIPLSARMFAIVDVFDALTSDRPYRAAWPAEAVYRYIQEEAGKHFDPRIVTIFLETR